MRIKNANENINVYILKDDHFIEKSMDEFYKVINNFCQESNS